MALLKMVSDPSKVSSTSLQYPVFARRIGQRLLSCIFLRAAFASLQSHRSGPSRAHNVSHRLTGAQFAQELTALMHQCRHRRAGDICDRFTLSVGSTFVARSQTVGRKDTWEEETAGMRCLSSAGVLLCLGVPVCLRACLDTSLSLSLCTCLVLLILPAQASGFPIRSRGPDNSLVLNTAHASLPWIIT